MPGPSPGDEAKLTRELFLRLLGIVYLIAFVSIWVQIDGLIGSSGILPVSEYLDAVGERFRAGQGFLAQYRHYSQLPTLLWLSSSDAALHAVCAAGVAFALLLIAGVSTIPVLGSLWALYLSLTIGGQVFLSFQWDTLLLETGLVSLLLVGWTWTARSWTATTGPDPRPGLVLLRLLLLKLMFLSGAVKLLSLDPTWWDLSALEYHYFTQPLPLATSWFAHHLPAWFHKLSVLLTYGIEMLVPWAALGPRRIRLLAFWPLLGLQILIAATGNYGFFNLLSAVLCVSLLDDRLCAAFWRADRARSYHKPTINRAPPGSAIDAAGCWLLCTPPRAWRCRSGRWRGLFLAARPVQPPPPSSSGATGGSCARRRHRCGLSPLFAASMATASSVP